MGSRTEWKARGEELLNLKVEQYKIHNLKNRKPTEKKDQIFRDLLKDKLRSNIHVIKVPKREENRVGLKNYEIMVK